MDVIRLAQINEIPRVYYPEGYKILKPKKFTWLARALWWGLKKLKALQPYMTEVIIYEYGPVEREKVSQALLAQMDYMAHSIMNYRNLESDFCIIMGGETFFELTEIMMLENITLPLNHFYHQDERGYRAEFKGMKVHVVPHVQGMAIIPKVLVERYK